MANILFLTFFTFLISCAHGDKPRVELQTTGVHHVGLSVKNLKATTDFFIQALNFKKVGEKPKYPAVFVSDGTVMVTLWQVETPGKATSFNRKTNIGLHHLALSVPSFSALDKMFLKVQQWPGVKVQFSPENLNGGPAKHTMFYEPGGIRIELIHKP